MEEKITQKWLETIATLKDGKTVKVTRSTVAKGKSAPFGTLTRSGNQISFQPARGVAAHGFTISEDKAAERLTDAELLSVFGF